MSIGKKLALKDGDVLSLVSAPANVRAHIEKDVGKSNVATKASAKTKALVTFVSSKSEVDRAAKTAMAAGDAGASVWFAYPKGRKDIDISRDKGWDALNAAGWIPVSLFAIDDAWSALRFKHDPKLQKQRSTRAFARKATTKRR